MDHYVRINASFLRSAVWQQTAHVRLVWLALLLLADESGRVVASVPGLAHEARVTLDECEDALQVFASPDAHARNRAHDGRLLEECEGGWQLLDFDQHAPHARRTPAQSAAAARQRGYVRRREQAIQRELSGQPAAPGEASFTPPADFQPGARTLAKARTLGVDPAAAVAAFVATRFDTPKVVWSGAFSSFLDAFARDHASAVAPDASRASASALRASRHVISDAQAVAVPGPLSVHVPADWTPKGDHAVRAQEMGIDFAGEVERFRLFEFAKPIADWDRRFHRWLIDARKRRETDRARERDRSIAGGGPIRARLQPDHGVTGFERLEG